MKQARSDMKKEAGQEDVTADYFTFGSNSPKRNNHSHELNNLPRLGDVDDWFLADKWGDSRYPSVPDSEAATAIESILNEELS